MLQCEVAQDPPEIYSIMGKLKMPVHKREPELRLVLAATVPHVSFDTPWQETIKIHYCIFGTDIGDGNYTENKIDKLANVHMGLDMKTRQLLRLAWIIWNGYQYAVEHIQLKEAIDAGWHPRVTRIETQY